jgi:hypothetical protein
MIESDRRRGAIGRRVCFYILHSTFFIPRSGIGLTIADCRLPIDTDRWRGGVRRRVCVYILHSTFFIPRSGGRFFYILHSTFFIPRSGALVFYILHSTFYIPFSGKRVAVEEQFDFEAQAHEHAQGRVGGAQVVPEVVDGKAGAGAEHVVDGTGGQLEAFGDVVGGVVEGVQDARELHGVQGAEGVLGELAFHFAAGPVADAAVAFFAEAGEELVVGGPFGDFAPEGVELPGGFLLEGCGGAGGMVDGHW